jgi:uncharacterized protein YkwD
MIRIINILSIIVFIALNWSCNDPEEINFSETILEEVNKLRREGCVCGEDTMPPVQEVLWDEALEAAARRHVLDMSQNDHFDHIGTDGSSPYHRTADAGFTGAYIGENIARGYRSINDVMMQWKNSNSHCKTMMDDHFYYMAVAYQDYYWVQLLGSN